MMLVLRNAIFSLVRVMNDIFDPDDKLHKAVKQNDVSLIKSLLNDKETNVYKLDEHGKMAIAYVNENYELLEVTLTEGSRFPLSYRCFGILRNDVCTFLDQLKQIIMEHERYKVWPVSIVRNYLLMLNRYEEFIKNSTLFWLRMTSGERTISRQIELILDPNEEDTTFNFFRINKMKPVDVQCIDRIDLLKTIVDFKDYDMFVHIFEILEIFDENSDPFRYFLYKKMFLTYKDLESNDDFLPDSVVAIECLRHFDFPFFLQLINLNKLSFLTNTTKQIVIRRTPNQNMEILKSGLNFAFIVHLLNDISTHFMDALVSFEFITLQESHHFYTACSMFVTLTKKFTVMDNLDYIYDRRPKDVNYFIKQINNLKTIYISSKQYNLFDLFICSKRFDLSNYCDEFLLLVMNNDTTVNYLREFLCIRFAEIKAMQQLKEILSRTFFPMLIIQKILSNFSNIDCLYFYFQCDNDFQEIYK